MYSLSDFALVVLNSIFKILKFKVDVLCIECSSGCVKLNFEQRCSFGLDILSLQSNSSCFNLNFTCTSSLRQGAIFLTCHLGRAKVNFAFSCSVELYSFFYATLPVLNLTLTNSAVYNQMCPIFHAILGDLNSILCLLTV